MIVYGNCLPKAQIIRNLFDGEVIDGYRGADDGTYYNFVGEFCTKNIIPILPNTQYCISGATNYVIFYDSNKSYLSSLYYVESVPFISPHDATYMHINFGAVETNDIRVTKGATALS